MIKQRNLSVNGVLELLHDGPKSRYQMSQKACKSDHLHRLLASMVSKGRIRAEPCQCGRENELLYATDVTVHEIRRGTRSDLNQAQTEAEHIIRWMFNRAMLFDHPCIREECDHTLKDGCIDQLLADCRSDL